ncbi:MAG: hypothetical protein AMXMBFR58_18040 [Phycisphaerae bacterium]
MTRSLQILLTDIVDYAGLFPPAALSMDRAAETYARARTSGEEWMLGRFVCPAARLDELSQSAAAMMPGTHATSGYRERVVGLEPWAISAIVDAPDVESLEKELDRIDRFNARHSSEDAGLARVDMAEIRVLDVQRIDEFMDRLPEDLFPFFEFPVTTDCRGFVAALSGSGAGAKIRTGGVVGNAFPTPEEVAAFIEACAAADVPFKATAGLHHPVRGIHPLTYEPGCASCTMHGFLNVFVAAVLVRTIRHDQDLVRRVIEDSDPANFRFSEEVLGWREFLVSVTDVARARESFALSFGSCSFDDPVGDLRKLGLL